MDNTPPPFPTEPLSIPEYVPPEPDPQAPEAPPIGNPYSAAATVLRAFTGASGIASLVGAAQQTLVNPDSVLDTSERTYKGKGDMLAAPKDYHVQRLRQTQSDPESIRQFDEKYGQGSASRYLNYASDKDVALLLKNRNDPEAVAGFNDIYGPDAAKYYIPFFDPKTSYGDRLRAGLDLKRIMLEGSNVADTISNSRPAQYAGSVVKGIEAAGAELTQSIGDLTGSETVQSAAKALERPDTRLVDDPVINGAISGISQFVAGFAAMNAITPGAGAVTKLAGAAKTAAHLIRGLSAGALTDAFAFDPNDPMIGNLAKLIEQKTGYKVMPNALRDYLTVENHTSDADKRLKRAIEGAGLGVVAEVFIGLAKTGRYALRGDKDAAKSAADAAADTLDNWSKIDNGGDIKTGTPEVRRALEERQAERVARDPVIAERQGERLLQDPDAVKQLDLPLEGGSNARAMEGEQLSFDHQPTFSEQNPHVDLGARMDLPEAGKPGQIDWLVEQQARAAREIDDIEQAVRDKWAPPAAQLDLHLPPGTRQPPGPTNLPGKPGDQIGFDFTEGNAPGAHSDVVRRDDLSPRLLDPLATDRPPQARPPRQSEAILVRQTEDEVIREAVDGAPAPVRDIETAVRGKPEPIRSGDDPVRQLVERIPDFPDNTLAGKDATLRPFVGDWLGLVTKHGEGLLAEIAKRFTPSEIEKLAPLFKLAAAEAKRSADDIAAEVRRLLDTGRGADAERLRAKDLAPARELAAQATRLAGETSSMAGRLLQSLKITDELVRAPATRAHIDRLRENGMSSIEIGNLVRESLDATKVDTKKLADLTAQAKAAREAGDDALAAKLDKDLATETNRVLAQAEREQSSWWKEFWRHYLDAKLSLMFYGAKTIAIANVIPNMVNMTSRGLAELYGQWRVRMTQDGFHPFLAMKESYLISASKVHGLRSGYESNLAALAQIAKDSGHAFLTGESKISGAGRIDIRGPQPFTSSYYGLEGRKAVAVDAVGSTLHLPFKLMALTDEALGAVVARSEIAAEATVRHLDAIRERKDVIKQVLKDKGLTGAERTKLRTELDQLNAGKVEQDGKLVSTTDYIDAEVGKRFDENGRLTDEHISRETDRVLLKHEFESGPGKALEDLLAKAPAAKALFLPIFRTPFRAIQAGFEFVPGFNRMPGFSQFAADLAGQNGPRMQAIAKGRALQGWAIMSMVAWKWLDGEITGPGPSDYESRKQKEASGSRANHIRVGDKWFDYSSFEPFGTAMKTAVSVLQAYEIESLRQTPDQTKLEMAGDMIKATAMAIATGILDNSMLTGMKNVVQLSQAAMSNNPDDAKSDALAQKFAAQQANSFVPQTIRALNDIVDPRMVEVLNVVDVYRAATFGKDQLAGQYTVLGTQREVDNPERSILGFLAPLHGKPMSRETYIYKSLDNLTLLTGARFTFQAKAPGSAIKDLRTERSMTGQGTVADVFAKNLRTVTVPDGGQRLEEALYDILTDKGAGQRNLAIGQYKSPGQLVETVKNTINRYRAAAWKLTEDQEVANHALQDAKAKERQLKEMTADPSKDKSVPWRLDQDFTAPTR